MRPAFSAERELAVHVDVLDALLGLHAISMRLLALSEEAPAVNAPPHQTENDAMTEMLMGAVTLARLLVGHIDCWTAAPGTPPHSESTRAPVVEGSLLR